MIERETCITTESFKFSFRFYSDKKKGAKIEGDGWDVESKGFKTYNECLMHAIEQASNYISAIKIFKEARKHNLFI